MTIYFTSDLHIAHNNILKYCERPFKDVETMAIQLIKNYFHTVKEGDTVFFLGDLTIKRGSGSKKFIAEIFRDLPGNKHLVIGNHDYYTKKFYMEECGFLSVNQIIKTKKFILVHRPDKFTASDLNSNRFLIHGHIHSHQQRDKRIFDCGVDANKFAPVSLETIKKYYKNALHFGKFML